jgi:DNA gyrase inhibitor GyrI
MRLPRLALSGLASSVLALACTMPPARELPEAPQAVAAQADGTWLVEPSWKERLPQHFVYAELRGDYRGFGSGMRRLLETLEGLDVEPSGPPFGLFFDDPASVALGDLRAWACVPVDAGRSEPAPGLGEGDLPGGVVVYGRVRGLGPKTSRAYPRLFELARRFGWTPSTPVREVYLLDAEAASSGADRADSAGWVTEIQIACDGA